MRLTCQNCGKEFSWYQRTTIKPKYCPNCTYKMAVSNSKGKKDISTTKNKSGLKRKKTDKQKAINRADEWFSRWVRLKNCVPTLNGYAFNICYTCGNIKGIKEIECGHWQRRGYKATRYHKDNARPQCTRCNKWLSGMPEKFEINLIEEIGALKVQELKELAQSNLRDSTEFYREQANKYRKLVNQLLKEKNINKWW